MHPRLSSQQLRGVLAVAEYRSFVAAASALGVSQPALTRTVKQVEAELGVQLFLRTTRLVTVTAAGKAFAATAERVLTDLKLGVASLRELAGLPRGQIVVSSVLSMAGPATPGLLATFSARFPGIEIHLREGIGSTVVDEVRAGIADIGIGYIDELPEAFAADRLWPETFYVALPAGHPLARRRRLDVAALADTPLVSFSPESATRRLIDRLAAEQGLALRHAVTANRLPTLLSLVRAGVGLAVTPASERPAADDPDLVSRRLVGQGLVRDLGVMRLRDRELPAPAAAFVDLVRRWRRETGAVSFRG